MMNSHPLQMTAKEQETLDWCYLALTEEQMAECEEQAEEIAGIELHQAEAAELLVRTLAGIQIRNVRAEINRAPTEKEAAEEGEQGGDQDDEVVATVTVFFPQPSALAPSSSTRQIKGHSQGQFPRRN
jgi:hypothetical protein